MKFFKLDERDITRVKGEFQCVGNLEGFVYVESIEELQEPFIECEELPHSLQNIKEQELKLAKQRLLASVLEQYETLTKQLVADTPISELLSWSLQEQEAKNFKESNNEADAPMLKILAQARGLELEALCDKVLSKAKQYRETLTQALAKRHSLEDKIKAATSLRALHKITQQAQEQAQEQEQKQEQEQTTQGA